MYITLVLTAFCTVSCLLHSLLMELEIWSMTVWCPLQVTGIYKGDWSQVYGLSFLVFNTDDKIQEVLTLMQPFPAQRKGLLKREE